MKKIIGKVTYNTNTAKLLDVKTVGTFGDETGYEERLYETKRGAYFLHCIGGSESKYKSEEIIPLTDEQKQAWENTN